MKILFCSTAFLLAAGSLSCQQNKTGTSAVRVSMIVPRMTPVGLQPDTISKDFYFQGSLRMLRITNHFDSAWNGKLLLLEDRYSYFVYEKDSAYGIHYVEKIHPGKPPYQLRLFVDSLMKNYATEFGTFEKEEGRMPDSSYQEGDGWVNVYQYKHTKEYPEDFTYYYHYSKAFSGIATAFSRKFDRYRGLKLNKIIIHAHGAYYEEGKQTLPARDYIYLMTEVPGEDIEVADGYFKRYLQASGR